MKKKDGLNSTGLLNSFSHSSLLQTKVNCSLIPLTFCIVFAFCNCFIVPLSMLYNHCNISCISDTTDPFGKVIHSILSAISNKLAAVVFPKLSSKIFFASSGGISCLKL